MLTVKTAGQYRLSEVTRAVAVKIEKEQGTAQSPLASNSRFEDTGTQLECLFQVRDYSLHPQN